MARVKGAWAVVAASAIGVLMTACGGSSGTGTNPPPANYTLTVDSTNPASGVSITGTAGTTPFTETAAAGTQYTLTAPSTASGNNFSSWSGCTSTSGTGNVTCSVTLNSNVTVTANYATPTGTTPTVTITPSSQTVVEGGEVSGTVTVTAPSGDPTPTGSVTLTVNGISTAPVLLSSGSASVSASTAGVQPNTYTVTATYRPDSNSPNYNSATGTATVIVTAPTTATLTVGTFDAGNGVTITASPADVNGVSSGFSGETPLALTYDIGTQVTLTAPSAASNGNTFSDWRGCTSATSTNCIVTVASGGTGVIADYETPPTDTLTIDSTNPASGVNVTASPVDVHNNSSGGTPLTLAYLPGTAVTVTAPATAGSDTFGSWTGCTSSASTTCNVTLNSNMTVTANYTAPFTGTTVTVDQSSAGAAVTNQILGMNLAAWYDIQTNATAITTAFGKAGIKAVRWPGGSQSDTYHWATNSVCNGLGYAAPNSTFANFVNDVVTPAGLDLALTANYGSNSACNAGGDPSEAAAWITNAGSLGVPVSHITVGNEEYGSWEYDLHSVKHDPTTYANAMIGSTGYYQEIKSAAQAASENTQVGVIVDANCGPSNGCTSGWDSKVLSTDKGSYDFVEYHYYPQNPGGENDTSLLYSAPAAFTTNINEIKSELTTAGEATTPIFVGEVGSVSSNPGKQSWSITQGLYAGQLLGEAMNDGVARLTWWIGFGNCNGNNGNLSSSLYGWQNFGAYNVFADGSGDTGGTNNSACNYGGPIGTMSPTAVAFQLFSNVAVNGENALTATVTGADTTDVKAYAATHSGGTALVLFNLNETTAEPVEIALTSSSGQQASTTDMKVITYDKALYDETNNATPVWAGPTTTDLGAQSLPYTLTLQPWSMNVVIIQ